MAELAGFKYSHEGDEYVCFTHKGTNSYKMCISTDETSLNYTGTEKQLLKRIFKECKRVGRIEVRQELNKIINETNYE